MSMDAARGLLKEYRIKLDSGIIADLKSLFQSMRQEIEKNKGLIILTHPIHMKKLLFNIRSCDIWKFIEKLIDQLFQEQSQEGQGST